MKRFFESLDAMAGVADEPGLSRWIDRTAFIFLALMVLTAPHSIAASQTSWLIALLATIVRFAFKPRRKFKFRPLDIATLAIFRLGSDFGGVLVFAGVVIQRPSKRRHPGGLFYGRCQRPDAQGGTFPRVRTLFLVHGERHQDADRADRRPRRRDPGHQF